MAWRRGRWDGDDFDVAEPFLYRKIPAVLSVWGSVFCLCMLKQSAINVWCITLPAIYRSLLVTWPSGLSQETSWDMISTGKYARRMMGCNPAGYGDVAASLGCCWGGDGHRSGSQEHFPSTHIPVGVLITIQSKMERHKLIQSCWALSQVLSDTLKFC